VEVKNSNISGRGVFALKDFEEGELIELAPSLIDDCGNFRGKVGDYMTYSPGDGSKCALNMGYFNYYNHKDDNNANYYVDAEKECISVISTRPIENGEEIFVNYGGAYWEARADRLKKL
jgi:SET domain-containing protein